MVAKPKELIRYPELVRNLVIRDLNVGHKNSVPGFLWSPLNRLGMIVIFAIVLSIMLPNNTIECFPVFILRAPPTFFAFSLDMQRLAYILNPTASLIASHRVVLYHGAPPVLDFPFLTFVTAVVFLDLVFLRYSPIFGEEL